MRRRLVLHFGITKTGSSALQVALSRNRAMLAEHGVLYPTARNDRLARAGGAASGNGIHLVPFLTPRKDTTEAEAQASLQELLGVLGGTDAHTVLYSSELFHTYGGRRPERLDALASSIDGWTPQAVLYVRDIAGHALSMYAQVVKRSRYTGSLADYLGSAGTPATYQLQLRERLGKVIDAFGRENVMVRHYDTEREHVIEAFMQDVLGIPADVPLDLSHGRVNRSLSAHEVALMRYANLRLQCLEPKEVAWFVSDRLIARPPVSSARLALSEAELDRLHERFDDDVAWVNREFFDGEPFQVATAGTVLTEPNNEVELSEKERILMDCLVDAAQLAYAKQKKPAAKKAADIPDEPRSLAGSVVPTPGGQAAGPRARKPLAQKSSARPPVVTRIRRRVPSAFEPVVRAMVRNEAARKLYRRLGGGHTVRT